MRVLWFCNVPTPEMYRHSGNVNERHGGHWVAQLSRHLSEAKDIELGIATAYPDLPESDFTEDGIRYFIIPQPHRFHVFDMRSSDIKRCAAMHLFANASIYWQPDIGKCGVQYRQRHPF